MYFCLSSYVTFFLCIPLLRSGVTLSYTAHMIHNLHNEDGFQTESSRLSQRCKCEVYCTLHQLQITSQIYTPDYTLGWKTFAKLECVGRSGGTAWCCRFPSGGGMNHITHSFHGTQNSQGTHRQLCMESYSSALCPVPSFYIQTCLCQNQWHPQRPGILLSQHPDLLLAWKPTETSKRDLRHTSNSRELCHWCIYTIRVEAIK